MSLDVAALADAVAAHGPVVRIVVADTAGSAPREAGAAMLVWNGGQSGTIGGGALELQAVERAHLVLRTGTTRFDRVPLGPALGQCCGGAVVLVSERFNADAVAVLAKEIVHARPVTQGAAQPLAVSRLLARARDRGEGPTAQLIQGWLVEAVAVTRLPLWIYGAGHVGRALVSVLAPMPAFAITWVDTGPERFPAEIPPGVTMLPAPDPEHAVKLAPAHAHHLILTYSHVLDLELCHALLVHKFASAGLIGSATKWARFRSRLHDLGHRDSAIDRISCPIGLKDLGKHPQAIAVGTASVLLDMVAQMKTNRESPGDAETQFSPGAANS